MCEKRYALIITMYINYICIYLFVYTFAHAYISNNTQRIQLKMVRSLSFLCFVVLNTNCMRNLQLDIIYCVFDMSE